MLKDEAKEPVHEGAVVEVKVNATPEKKSKQVAPPKPLTDDEKAAITKWKERLKVKPKSPVVCKHGIKEDGLKRHSYVRENGENPSREILNSGLCMATGTTDPSFAALLYASCISGCGPIVSKMERSGDLETGILNALHSMQPKDEVEGMLITKLISLQMQSMNYLGLSSSGGRSPQEVDLFINRSTKLMRLFNETLESLMRYRRKGEQKVVVQHIQINDNGKAVVNGPMGAGGGG